MTDRNINPLVSISSMSKNLEGIIGDGIKSWLAQQTTFEFDIVISDDLSTDHTVTVMRTFEKENPGRITVLTTDKPLGLGKNWIKSMQACKGKYIAFCDGDDLWTDPLKLQKQIDYLEANPDCNLICSDYDYLSEKGEFIVSEWKQNWYDKKFDILENLKHDIATTLTVVIRRSALEPLLNKISVEKHPFIWDSFLWAFTLQNGYGYFYPEKMALRRVQASGIYTTKSPIGKYVYDYGAIQSIKTYIKDRRVQEHASSSLYALNLTVAKEHFKLGDKSKGRAHLLKSAISWDGFSSVSNNIKYVYWLFKSFALKIA